MSTQVSARKTSLTMETLTSLCKRRGFIFQSSEIYGGANGFFDYGPLGIELKRNIKAAWWRDMVHRRDDIVGLDSSIIMNAEVWKSSGHIQGFSDPMVDCKESKARYRADQLFFAKISIEGNLLGYISLLEDDRDVMREQADKQADKMKRKAARQGILDKVTLRAYTEADPSEYALIPSPATGRPGSLTAPRNFNLMFETHVGALSDASSIAYLRPETAQGIFTNFKNVVDSSRVKLPFGIAQIGKAFRNEITPRNYIFRSREFEQMEIEYFFANEKDEWKAFLEEWVKIRWDWMLSIGIREELMGREHHPKEKLAHYARACVDITFKFPFGEQELEGIAARGNYDLEQHQKGSGKPLEYFDEASKKKFLPHVIEPSLGVDRLFLALMCSAYDEDEVDGEKRAVLKFHPRVAPVKAAVFPLVKNKPELVEKARKLYEQLRRRWNIMWDVSGAIGRRYRRMDEIGTPYCITVDFDSLEDDTVTLRDRNTTKQERIAIDALEGYLFDRIER